MTFKILPVVAIHTVDDFFALRRFVIFGDNLMDDSLDLVVGQMTPPSFVEYSVVDAFFPSVANTFHGVTPD